jgi:hypothetical protein
MQLWYRTSVKLATQTVRLPLGRAAEHTRRKVVQAAWG